MFYTFRGNGWQTIETAFAIPGRRLCVSPTTPLRVKTAFFTTGRSSSGCIEYGGVGSYGVQRVQANGRRGRSISIQITTPLGVVVP